jgi:YgiT-type zinc finger domain-containing protein
VNALFIYSKTKPVKEADRESNYLLVSSKRSILRMDKLNITSCPSCRSKRIELVRRNRTSSFKGKEYMVPNLEYYECPDCGEKVYDREAMREIQAHSPAFKQSSRKRKIPTS